MKLNNKQLSVISTEIKRNIERKIEEKREKILNSIEFREKRGKYINEDYKIIDEIEKLNELIQKYQCKIADLKKEYNGLKEPGYYSYSFSIPETVESYRNLVDNEILKTDYNIAMPDMNEIEAEIILSEIEDKGFIITSVTNKFIT